MKTKKIMRAIKNQNQTGLEFVDWKRLTQALDRWCVYFERSDMLITLPLGATHELV